jgi:hypothetical protein
MIRTVLIVGRGQYERAKQSYLAEDYAAVIPACEEEIAANLPKVNYQTFIDCR